MSAGGTGPPAHPLDTGPATNVPWFQRTYGTKCTGPMRRALIVGPRGRLCMLARLCEGWSDAHGCGMHPPRAPAGLSARRTSDPYRRSREAVNRWRT